MKSFHANLLKPNQTKDAALQSAKMELMSQGNRQAHPFYWAGFIPVGDMRALLD